MSYKVLITFEYGADDYYLEEEFDTHEEAYEAALDELSNWSAGAKY